MKYYLAYLNKTNYSIFFKDSGLLPKINPAPKEGTSFLLERKQMHWYE